MFSTFPVPFNPSIGNRVYIRKKKGIAVKSRCRDGPAAAAAAIFMFYCIGLGATLLQNRDGHIFPVAYASRKLLDREKRYSVMERECLGIVWGIKKFALYLYGKQFTLQTDHRPLEFLKVSKFDNPRIMRWVLALQFCF